jgi:hypothetical protein
MPKIINLTPHEIKVYKDGEIVLTLPSEGIARAESKSIVIDSVNEIDITRVIFGEPIDLPEPEGDTFYVVSRITIESAAAAGRTTDDLLTTDRLVRDENGRVIGCESFARI